MTIQEVKNIDVGTVIYKIFNAEITPWIYLGPHPAYSSYIGVGSKGNVSKAEYKFLDAKYTNEVWETDYDKAKEEMWRQLMRKVDIVNKVYFDGTKKFNHLSTE